MFNSRGNSRIVIIQICLLMILIGLVYWSTLKGMIKIWSTDDDYSHAFLLPLIVGYLVWDNRRKIAKVPVTPFWPASALLLFTWLFAFYGILGSDISAARISWWLMVISVVLLCYGLTAFKQLFLSIIMLGFTIPLPDVINSKLMVSLKLISSKVGGIIIHAAGYPVFVQGNLIDLGITQLQVVDACSGLRFVLPLIALGLVCAYYFQKTLWKRIVLVALTFPIAVGMNALRIGLTGILHNTIGAKAAEGFFHGFSGWLIFMVSIGCLLFCNWLMNKFFRSGTAGHGHAESPAQGTPDNGERHQRNTLPVIICSVVLLTLFLSTVSVRTMPRLALSSGMAGFPLQIAEWTGIKESLDPAITIRSGAEEAFAGSYQNSRGENVSLYLGYRGSPFLESEEFFHSPNVCLPSQGWKELEENVVTVPKANPRFTTFKVRRMLIEAENQRMLVYYWFQTKNSVSDVIFRNRFHLAIHALKHDNTTDTFVRLMTPVRRDGTVQGAQERLEGFVRDLEPVLLKFLDQARPLKAVSGSSS